MALSLRSFFARMLASAAAVAAGTAALEADDPERLLCEPGRKRIFLPTETPQIVQSAPAGIRLATDRELQRLSKISQRSVTRGPGRYVMIVQSKDMRLNAHFDEHWNITEARDSTPGTWPDRRRNEALLNQFLEQWETNNNRNGDVT